MLADETLKALIEGIIYVAPEPVSVDAITKALEGEERERIKAKLEELVADYNQNSHGIQIRQVANGYKFSTKAEHHEVLRKYVKSLRPAVRLSRPALETLAVIAYRQPVTMPEIEEIRGVDSGGVIHTLLEKKLVVTAGRKSVVGRPILYRTSRDFLVHFGLKDVGELPSLKEFEELARRALGSDWTGEAAVEAVAEPVTTASAPAAAEPEPPPGPAGETVQPGSSPEQASEPADGLVPEPAAATQPTDSPPAAEEPGAPPEPTNSDPTSPAEEASADVPIAAGDSAPDSDVTEPKP
jgi:segregation and condensation protein B